jgi:hypothetical protein
MQWPRPKDTLEHAVGCQSHNYRMRKTLPHWRKFASSVDCVVGID